MFNNNNNLLVFKESLLVIKLTMQLTIDRVLMLIHLLEVIIISGRSKVQE
jgi:hypothetical protein